MVRATGGNDVKETFYQNVICDGWWIFNLLTDEFKCITCLVLPGVFFCKAWAFKFPDRAAYGILGHLLVLFIDHHMVV